MYYDQHGQPLTATEWAVRHANFSYTVVVRDHVLDWLVSTVWLGIDHSFGQGRPVIFETMVFPPDSRSGEEYCARYTTETQARAGHRYALAWTQARAGVEYVDCDGFRIRVVPDDPERPGE